MKFIDSECECLTHTVGFSKRELFLYYNTPCHSSRNMLRRNMKHTFKLLIVFLVKFEYFCQLLQSSSVKKKCTFSSIRTVFWISSFCYSYFPETAFKNILFQIMFSIAEDPPYHFLPN